VAALAAHYRMAGAAADPAKVLDYSLRAGQASAAIFAWEEAAAHWQAALEIMEERGTPPLERAELLERLGDLIYVTGAEPERGIGYIDQARKVYEAEGQTERAAQMRSRIGFHLAFNLETLDIGRAMEHFRAAEPVLTAGPERAAQVYYYIGLASAALWGVRQEQGLAASRRAVEIVERLGLEPLWANAAALHGWFLCSGGRVREGMALLERAWDVADRSNHAMAGFLCAWWRGVWASMHDDPREAQSWYLRELSKPRLSQAPIQRRYLLGALAFAHVFSGELEKARALLDEANPEGTLMVASGAEGVLKLWRGDLAGENEHCARGIEIFRKTGSRAPEWATLVDWARVQGLQGFHDRAESLCAEALEIVLPQSIPHHEFFIRHRLALLKVERGHAADALPELERCREAHATLEDPRGVSGLLAQVEAVVAAALGRGEEAEGHFAKAMAIFERYELVWEKAETVYQWGLALRSAGDLARAMEKLDAALDIYRSHGAGTFWLERVLAEKLRAQGVVSSDVATSIDTVALAVQCGKPDLRPHASPDGTVTLVFSDMQGFTEMTERLGDLRAHQVIRDHNTIVREQVKVHGGVEVELQGDGFLLAFPRAADALACSIAIQRTFETYCASHPEQPIRVRIGLHTGEAIAEADRFFGKTVILAARIAAQARGGEILVSSAVREYTNGDDRIAFGEERHASLKGLAGDYTLHPVHWTDASP
jgi:class 3 adenylate cyclase/tetratricopeptide (TPR) repeat protein